MYSSLYSPKPVHTKTDKGKEIQRFYYIDIKKALDPSCDRVDAIISVPETRKITSNFGRKDVLMYLRRIWNMRRNYFRLI